MYSVGRIGKTCPQLDIEFQEEFAIINLSLLENGSRVFKGFLLKAVVVRTIAFGSAVSVLALRLVNGFGTNFIL